MEQQVLDERLLGADHVPVHIPASARKEEIREFIIFCSWVLSTHAVAGVAVPAVEDDEEAQLKELQAALAM